MNTTIINVLLFSLCGFNSLYANPLPTSALKQKTPDNKALIAEPNFSGTWQSSNCPGEDNDVITMAIQHDGNYIEFDSSGPLPIGTMETKSNSGLKTGDFIEPDTSVTSIEWNLNKTQLIHRGTHVSKIFFDQGKPHTLNNAMHVVMDYNTMELDNIGQLVLTFTSAEFKDLKQVDEWSIACVFTKVSEYRATRNNKKSNKFKIPG